MNNIIVTDTPLVKRDITILRDKQTREEQFRSALNRIAFVLVNEISKQFTLSQFPVETPLMMTNGFTLAAPVVLVPVLRAGLSLVQPFLQMIPDAKVGHIGLRRDEETLEPIDYYYKVPKDLDISTVILLDPMLATGGSAAASFAYLKHNGAKHLLFASLIAAPEGIERMNKEHPDVLIYTAAIDKGLNENGFIIPGLGDAGDRTFGTL